MITALATTNSLLPVDDRHRQAFAPIGTPDRLLLGPGPSNAHPTVLKALSRTPIGHLDPLYVDLMGEVQELLRYAWQTDNRLTLPMSGTGSAAMEATIANTVEPGDTVLVAVKGTSACDWLTWPAAICLLYTSPSPRDLSTSRMPSSA